MKQMFYACMIWLVLSGAPAYAEIEFGLDLFYQKYTLDNGSSTEETRSFYDAKLGYLMASGLYLGGIYGVEEFDYGTSEDERKNLGATVGYSGPAFFILGHYLLSTELESGSSKYEGTGLQVDLGYVFPLMGSLLIGPELTYRSYTYDKLNGATLATKRVETRLDPAIVLRIRF